MLSNFATELIEEILIYLPYREFLRVIRLNSRLWKIAHHPKSPLRHRLRGRTSRISLTLGDDERDADGNIYLYVPIAEVIPDSTCTRLIERRLKYVFPKVSITDEPYVESEEDRSTILMEKPRMQLNYKTADDLDGMKNSYETYNYDQFSPDLSMRLAIFHISYIIENLTINKKFQLDVHDGILLNKFLLHFDAHDIRLPPISFRAVKGKFDLPRLYESKFFQQKINWLSFSSDCKAIGNNLDIRHYEIHRNKLREVKHFMKHTNIPIKHHDDDLLLLDNIRYLRLYGEDEITGNGIARLVKKIYENKQGRRIYIEIRTKRKFTIEEALKYVPERKITKATRKRVDFTNMSDEIFTIKCCNIFGRTCFKLEFSHT